MISGQAAKTLLHSKMFERVREELGVSGAGYIWRYRAYAAVRDVVADSAFTAWRQVADQMREELRR